MRIEMKNISKAFNGNPVLKNAQFSIETGEVHALMGENGAGKSTLMKILTGVYTKDSGQVTIDGQERTFKNAKEAEEYGIAFIHQELNILPNLTVAENMFLGKELMYGKTGILCTRQMNGLAQQQLASLGLHVKGAMLAGELSVGQQQIIEIGKALMTNASVIIMDEPTAALTDREIETLFTVINKLRKEGVSFVYISHRMEEIFSICDAITILRDGEYVGTRLIPETSFDEVVSMMVGRSIGERYPERDAKIGEVIFEMRNATKKGKFENISFQVRKGEILGVAGLMGAGRTDIMKAIFGHEPLDSGQIFMNGQEVKIDSPIDAIRQRIAFITEDRKSEGLVLDFSIRENLALPNLGNLSKGSVMDKGVEAQFTEDMMKLLNVKAANGEQAVKSLSGGNQQKIVIAKWLGIHPQLLILDEPTRGVDVGAKKEIYSIMNKLTKQGDAVIMVSSELPEVLGMSDRVLVIHEGKVGGILEKDKATQESIMALATGGE
ncbi:sugar ABC transporter ATP-binding protein [Bacillus pseudomycoides]|uniref:Sugar ABC transporter ATP-binding protein n=1 Tax=Bacillus pseudomycoides TaxID=64104 RepID=A0ABD6T9A3_9BACI|nr:sugar ABC transporter ATP-binding protein [Bacillus pseudomycoides]PEF22601.1 sugar ABC transporter ATP-binding protein [Bacillus pseudomycoides]PEK33906.1 sugar ABC transporter ATP-binding protein [Bacillus pseudomycoides]PEK63486.1 sugar ABC transporter ATP-binding protein [Bacillus pseudomycoides]PEP39944.1 sugar ABC transporter ATP-binding protein [Bacillus pseudomycoides]PEP41264.1 sugar ABC transporter ATP-binding protein [Bacillus pseudomycoides]